MELVRPSSGRSRGNGNGQSGSSFYLEVLVLILAVLLMTVVLVAMLAHARSLSVQAQRTTDATMIASDIAQTYVAAADDSDFIRLLQQQADSVSYERSGLGRTDVGAGGNRNDRATVVVSEGDAAVRIALSTDDETVGTLSHADISVSYAGTVYGHLATARYQSDWEGAR